MNVAAIYAIRATLAKFLLYKSVRWNTLRTITAGKFQPIPYIIFEASVVKACFFQMFQQSWHRVDMPVVLTLPISFMLWHLHVKLLVSLLCYLPQWFPFKVTSPPPRMPHAEYRPVHLAFIYTHINLSYCTQTSHCTQEKSKNRGSLLWLRWATMIHCVHPPRVRPHGHISSTVVAFWR